MKTLSTDSEDESSEDVEPIKFEEVSNPNGNDLLLVNFVDKKNVEESCKDDSNVWELRPF